MNVKLVPAAENLMSDWQRLKQLRQACNDIRRIYGARMRTMEDLKAKEQAMAWEWRKLIDSKLGETDMTRRRELRRRQSELIAQRQSLQSEIQRRRELLQEYQNDFDIRRCAAVVPPL